MGSLHRFPRYTDVLQGIGAWNDPDMLGVGMPGMHHLHISTLDLIISITTSITYP